MIVVWGTRLYGKVDKTPSGVHIATNFFYLQFIPLIPTKSVIVLRGDRMVDAPFSFKSVLVAYTRTAGFVGGIFGSILAFTMISSASADLMPGIMLLLASLFGLAFAIGSYFIPGIGVASASRAKHIEHYLERLTGRSGMTQKRGERRGAAGGRRRFKPPPGAADASGAPEPVAAVSESTSPPPVEEEEEQPVDNPFLVECPTCEKQLEARLSMVGQTLNCPACQNLLEIGDPYTDA